MSKRVKVPQDLPNLDLVRSIAVLLVVSTHIRTYMTRQIVPLQRIWFLGLVGVFMFFVHTSLVLMWSLERDPHTWRFYLRRAFRIYPLWLFVLCASVLVRLPTSPATAPQFAFAQPSPKEFLANAALVMNLTHYGVRIIGASWSLPVEVQMYAVLPLLFFFARANRSVLALLALDLLAIATARQLRPAISSDFVFCVPLFIPGVIAYLGFSHWRPRLPAWFFLPWVLALAEACNAWASAKETSFRSGWAFALVLGFSLPLFQQLRWRPLTRTAQLVARYSYGLYLFHFAAIAVALHYMRGFSPIARMSAFVFVLAGLSITSYHWIELPMIRFGSRLAKRIEHGPEPAINADELKLEMAP